MAAYKSRCSKFKIGNRTKICFKTEKFKKTFTKMADSKKKKKSGAHDLYPAVRPPKEFVNSPDVSRPCVLLVCRNVKLRAK